MLYKLTPRQKKVFCRAHPYLIGYPPSTLLGKFLSRFCLYITTPASLLFFLTNNILLFLKVWDFRILCGKISLWRSRNTFPLLRACSTYCRIVWAVVNPQLDSCKHNNTLCGNFYYIKPYWTAFCRIKWALQDVSELGYLFLDKSSLHICWAAKNSLRGTLIIW